MRQECIHAVQAVIGRDLTAQEVNGIEARVRRNLQALARENREAFLGMSADARLIEAGARAARELVHEAQLKKVRVALTIKAHDTLLAHLKDSTGRGLAAMSGLARTLVFTADGKSGFISAETRAEAVKRDALRQLVSTFEAIDPRFFGLFENAQGVRDLTLEVFGKDSGNPLAKKGAEAWLKVAEALRRRFNEAGGDIGKLENWNLPYHHSQMKVARAGRDAWAADILPALERSRYVNEDGSAFSDQQLQEFLGKVYETISTGGVNKLEPGAPRGTGMRANRNAEPRQLHFRGPDEYLAYQAKYGEKDLYGLMVSHVGALAKDIAMIETFGPNASHTYSFFRDTVLQEATKANPRQAGKIREQAVKMDGLYDYVAGRSLPVANEYLARGFDTLRNWMVATRLGSAFITAFSDEATLYMTAHVNNLPEMQVLKNELAALNPANRIERRMAQRAGLALDTLIGELNRYGQDGLGSSFSSRLANTTMRLSGLNAITDARKRAFGVTMMDAIGALTREVDSVKKLDPTDWKILKSKGITEIDWKIWKLAETENWNGTNSTMLTPESVARIPDAKLEAEGLTVKDQREAVTKLLGAVLEETDVAVITPGARERAMMGGGLQRGTWKGELTRSFFLFKSFPIAMIMRHWMRGNGMETAGGKAAYIASLMVATTALGALSLQVDQILQGKDPRTFNPNSKGGIRNMFAAMLKGGSLGIYGDFLFSEATHGGHRGAFASIMGPVAGLVEEALNLTQGNLVQYAQGKDTRAGAELIRFLRSNTPGANLWYAKAALDHLIWNQAAEYLSPGYLATVRSRARREFGQDYWWAPEDRVPVRAPDISRIVE